VKSHPKGATPCWGEGKGKRKRPFGGIPQPMKRDETTGYGAKSGPSSDLKGHFRAMKLQITKFIGILPLFRRSGNIGSDCLFS
jgi:hypothetical protein